MAERESILIVDDDESTCRSLTLLFGEKGYEIETVGTGREAIERIEERFFNLVIADIKLPDMEGVELIGVCRQLHSDLVLIMITAYASLETAIRALNEGASAYVTKPLNVDAVLATVREALEKQRLVVENRGLYEAVKRELAERNRALKALQASEASLRNLITSNADGMIIVDKEGIVHFANPAAETLFGREGDQFLGEAIGLPIQAGKAANVEIMGTNGEVTTAEMSVADIEWEGRSAYLASVRDITERKRAAEELKRSYEKIRRIFEQTVKALASAVEMREPYTAGHQQRVTRVATIIAEELGLPEDQISGLRMAGVVHDIGKLSIPAEILSKTIPLTKIEWEMIKNHPRIGYEILKSVEFPWPVAETVLQHHERMNGSGYPQGLAGQDILLEARILSVADTIEAMSYPRPYRMPVGIEKALEEISQNRGILYDPDVVDACLKPSVREWLFRLFKFEEEMREMREERLEFDRGEQTRLVFWRRLLTKSSERTKLHETVSPRGKDRIGTGAGQPGLAYNYFITRDWGGVELHIDRGEHEETAKEMFDALCAKRKEIESDFGESLGWEHIEGGHSYRIGKRFEDAGLKDEDKWDELQNEMIDGMIRLERSLRRHIARLAL